MRKTIQNGTANVGVMLSGSCCIMSDDTSPRRIPMGVPPLSTPSPIAPTKSSSPRILKDIEQDSMLLVQGTSRRRATPVRCWFRCSSSNRSFCGKRKRPGSPSWQGAGVLQRSQLASRMLAASGMILSDLSVFSCRPSADAGRFNSGTSSWIDLREEFQPTALMAESPGSFPESETNAADVARGLAGTYT